MSQIFATCQRTLRFTWKSKSQAKLTGHFSPIIPSFADRGLSCRLHVGHLEAKVGTSKGGGKQWQPTPKKLPRMQCARAIPVAWLGSGSYQNRPSGWILMMMMIIYIMEKFCTAVQSALQTAPVCLTVQALLIHCSTKTFRTVRHVSSTAAFYIGIYRVWRTVSSL